MGKSTKSTENTDGHILVAKDVVGLQNQLMMKMIMIPKNKVRPQKQERLKFSFGIAKCIKKLQLLDQSMYIYLPLSDYYISYTLYI